MMILPSKKESRLSSIVAQPKPTFISSQKKRKIIPRWSTKDLSKKLRQNLSMNYPLVNKGMKSILLQLKLVS